jgi:hypothetical protein
MGKPMTAARMAAAGALAALAACAARPIEPPVESLTVSRVMGHDVPVEPLLPVQGSVWPDARDENQRGTLGNPDAGIRPTDNQRPGSQSREPMQRRGSSTPPNLLPSVTDASPALRQPTPPPAPVYAPPARAEGRVIPTPQGPVTTTTGGPGYATYTTPEGATGIAVPQGSTTTLLDADGRVRQVPTPR